MAFTVRANLYASSPFPLSSSCYYRLPQGGRKRIDLASLTIYLCGNVTNAYTQATASDKSVSYSRSPKRQGTRPSATTPTSPPTSPTSNGSPLSATAAQRSTAATCTTSSAQSVTASASSPFSPSTVSAAVSPFSPALDPRSLPAGPVPTYWKYAHPSTLTRSLTNTRTSRLSSFPPYMLVFSLNYCISCNAI